MAYNSWCSTIQQHTCRITIFKFRGVVVIACNSRTNQISPHSAPHPKLLSFKWPFLGKCGLITSCLLQFTKSVQDRAYGTFLLVDLGMNDTHWLIGITHLRAILTLYHIIQIGNITVCTRRTRFYIRSCASRAVIAPRAVEIARWWVRHISRQTEVAAKIN